MTTTEQNPAKEEYFDQLLNLVDEFHSASQFDEEEKYKDRILGVTYDANVALQKENAELMNSISILTHQSKGLIKRVEELEAALQEYVDFHERIQSLGFINRVVGAPIKSLSRKLLNKQS